MTVYKARKKTIEVDVFIKWEDDNISEVEKFIGINDFIEWDYICGRLSIWNDLESDWINVPVGHYIIKGIRGEFYPCDPEVFKLTYDIIE